MIAGYFILVLFIGLYNSSNIDSSTYLYSSRKLTLPSFIATIVTTWYGGILAVGDYVYENGIIAWVVFCLFYYIAAIVYALYFAPKIIKYKIATIPAYFNKNLGKKSAIFVAFIIILLSSPAPYIMIFCTIINHIYDINIIYSILASSCFTILYCYKGGLHSVIKTDKLQFVLMYLGFIGIVIILFNNYGGISYIIKNTPQNFITLSITDVINVLPWSIIAITMFIDPNIVHRTFLGKDTKSVQMGMFISIILWFIFDILTIGTGMYAISIIGDIQPGESVYLVLADIILNPIFRDIFFISLLSIVMSTIDSFTFTSSYTISNDLLPLIFKNYDTNKKIIYTKYSIISTSILAIILIIALGYDRFNYAIEFWYQIGSLTATTILIPYIFLLHNKKIKNSLITHIIPGLIFITVSYIYPGVSAIYTGLICSLILCLFFSRN